MVVAHAAAWASSSIDPKVLCTVEAGHKPQGTLPTAALVAWGRALTAIVHRLSYAKSGVRLYTSNVAGIQLSPANVGGATLWRPLKLDTNAPRPPISPNPPSTPRYLCTGFVSGGRGDGRVVAAPH